MTNTPDTSPEAVERLREYAEAIRGAADQIEALSAALEAEKLHKLAITGDKINAVSELRQVKAERDALKAELNAEHQQAKDILRAFLARHQKETGV